MSPSEIFLSSRTFSPWLAYLIIVMAVLLTAIWFLLPTPLEFPIDDAYVHLVYAQNIAEHGRIAFNFTNEPGVGITSLLWVLLLAEGHSIGLSMPWLAKLFGLLSLAGVGMGLFLLLHRVWGATPALMGALLVTLSGNVVWFSLSGVETMLFVALGVLTLLVHKKHKWVWLGVVLALLTLTRPEGSLLGVVILAVELWSPQRDRRYILLTTGMIWILICGAWFGYLFWRYLFDHARPIREHDGRLV